MNYLAINPTTRQCLLQFGHTSIGDLGAVKAKHLKVLEPL